MPGVHGMFSGTTGAVGHQRPLFITFSTWIVVTAMYTLTLYNIGISLVSLLSMILPAIVIYVVVFESPEGIRQYKRFIINFTVFDFVFAMSLGIIVKPYPLFPFHAASIEGPIKYFGGDGAVISIVIIINSAGYAMSTQCACIIYRFAILQANPKILEFVISWNTWIVCYVVTFFITAFTVFLAAKVQIPQDQVYARLVEDQKNYPGSEVPDITGRIVFYINSDNDFTALAGGLIMFGFFAAEVISIGCVYMILKELEAKKASFSKVTYRLHRQLTIALGIQLSIPIFFIIIPVIIGMVLAYIKFSGGNHYMLESGVLFIDLYGATNALITLYFVKPYRDFLVLKFKDFIFIMSCGKVGKMHDAIAVTTTESTITSVMA